MQAFTLLGTELHSMYSTPNTAVKSRRMRWTRYVACMGGKCI